MHLTFLGLRNDHGIWQCIGGDGLVTKSCPTLGTPWTVACQAPLSMEFSRQKCLSGLPFHPPGDLPNPGIKPASPAFQADSLQAEQQGKPKKSGVSKESACQCRRCRCDPWVRKIPQRRKWQSIPVFLPGKSHGQKSLVGYSPWGHKQLDMTEHTSTPSRDKRGRQPFRVFSCLGM